MRFTVYAFACALAIAGCDNPAAQRPANTGSVRGFVFLAGQPQAGASVSGAGQTITAAKPAAAADPDTDNGDAHRTVMHDFGDGHGRVICDRVLLKYGGTDGSKYAYLRTGEYLFEALPAGSVKLTASLNGKSGTLDVTVAANDTKADQNLNLDAAVALRTLAL